MLVDWESGKLVSGDQGSGNWIAIFDNSLFDIRDSGMGELNAEGAAEYLAKNEKRKKTEIKK
jgi:hypothetical protein